MATAVVIGIQKHQRLLDEEEEKKKNEEDGDGENGDGVEEDLPKWLAKVRDLDLDVCRHMDHGQFHLINIGDIEELFKVLGQAIDGRLCLQKIKEVLMRVVDPPFRAHEVDALFGSFVQDGDYNASFILAKEMHGVLQSSTEEMEMILNERRKKDQNVTRTLFQTEVARIVDRDDAFMTLPITIVYMVIFVYIIQGHLRIYERRSMENALEEFTNGRDPRETADENIDDMDSLWEWIVGPGLRAALADVQDSTNGQFKQCVMSSRNVLIGDVKLTKWDPDETSIWLLGTDTAKAHLASNPHDYQAAAILAAEELKDNGWESSDILSMRLSFGSYNEWSMMFAITRVTIPLPELGHVHSKIDSSAVSIQPYPSYDLYVADSLFLCLALWIGVQELMDALAALRNGLGEFVDYLAFWNVVDWINIILCSVTAISWLNTIMFMIDDDLSNLYDDDYKLAVDVMALDSAMLDKITAKLESLRLRYWILQFCMAANTVTVVLKFFKSFQSNARLRVVSRTFQNAAVDLVHFAIMFTTIFLPFVIIGHILFGSDIEQFASVTASINTGIVCLMGDFEWYVENYPTYASSLLPSGMPKVALMVWYVSFMFLVFLVLLNMLLAVILEHYTLVSKDVQYEIDAPAVWEQAYLYWKYTKQTKGFIALEKLRGDLEIDDEEDRAHKDESVTVQSLLEAWPHMCEAQAAWLMDLLDDGAQKKSNAAEKRAKADHVKHLAEENKEKLITVSDSILENKKRLDSLEGVGDADGTTDIGGGLDKLANIVAELNVSVAKVRREHDRLSTKVDDMMGAIPPGSKLEFVPGSGSKEKARDKASTEDSLTAKANAREWKKEDGKDKGLPVPDSKSKRDNSRSPRANKDSKEKSSSRSRDDKEKRGPAKTNSAGGSADRARSGDRAAGGGVGGALE